MGNFLKKIYNIFLRQNGWWLDQFEAAPSRPLIAGFLLFICYITTVALFNVTPTKISGIVLGITLMLISFSGVLWIREGRFPYYITGIFRGSYKFQKLQAIFWVIFWGGMGLLLITATLLGW